MASLTEADAKLGKTKSYSPSAQFSHLTLFHPHLAGMGPLKHNKISYALRMIYTSRKERRQGRGCPGPGEVGLEAGCRGREAMEEGAWDSLPNKQDPGCTELRGRSGSLCPEPALSALPGATGSLAGLLTEGSSTGQFAALTAGSAS